MNGPFLFLVTFSNKHNKENLCQSVHVSEWEIFMATEIGSVVLGLVLWDLIISLICSTSIAMNIDGAQLKFSIMDST